MKTVLIITVLMMLTPCIMRAQTIQSAQNRADLPSFYLNTQLEFVDESSEADYFGQVVFETISSVYVEVFRMKSGTSCFHGEFTNRDLQTQHGAFQFYFPNGKVESQGQYKNGVKIGTWLRFNLDGSKKSELYYSLERYELLSQLSAESKH